MRALRRLAWGLGVGAVALALACATPRSEAPATGDGLGRNFFVRQHLTARFSDEERRFDTALQSRCGELRLVGLTPFGVRLFTAVRRNGNLDVETLTGQPLPFSPEHVLRDIERTFFRSPPPGAGASGTRVVTWAGEAVRETFRDGTIVSRKIAVEADDAPGGGGPLVIRYLGPFGPAGISERVELSNPAFGYVLDIRNYEIEELECRDAP